MKHKLVIVDADAIVAQGNPEDANYQKATKISQQLIKLGVQVIYPVTAIAEASTVLQHKVSSAIAFGTVQLMTEPIAQVVEVNKQTLINAHKYFSSTTSKKNTIFDCIIAAVAEEYEADAIFSFDRFYVKKGFTLAEDLE
jgi:predicted nucleic acid-binding protein